MSESEDEDLVNGEEDEEDAWKNEEQIKIDKKAIEDEIRELKGQMIELLDEKSNENANQAL